MHRFTSNPASRQVKPSPAPISALAMTCLAHCPDPDTIERMGLLFIETAREMRGALVGGVGHA